jgi:hypothetical protein
VTEQLAHAGAYLLGFIAVLVYLGIASIVPKAVGGPIGLIRGEDGRLSTSKFQFFWWTGVVVFSYVALFAADAQNTWGSMSCPKTTAVEPAAQRTDPWCPISGIPPNVLLAMGFSLITLATAKGVTSAYVSSGRIIKSQGTPSIADLVSQDGVASPDLAKVQMLTWTLVATATYLLSTVAAVPHFSGGSLPDISSALMVLMGLGQGAYLGNKIVTSQNIVINRLDPPRGGAPGTTLSVVGSGFGDKAGIVQFGDVVAAIALDTNGAPQWGDAMVKCVIPPCHSNGAQFTAGETVYVAMLLQGSNTTAASNTAPFTF